MFFVRHWDSAVKKTNLVSVFRNLTIVGRQTTGKKKKKKINNKRIIACKKCYEKYEECCVEYRKGWCYLGQPVKASPGK